MTDELRDRVMKFAKCIECRRLHYYGEDRCRDCREAEMRREMRDDQGGIRMSSVGHISQMKNLVLKCDS